MENSGRYFLSKALKKEGFKVFQNFLLEKLPVFFSPLSEPWWPVNCQTEENLVGSWVHLICPQVLNTLPCNAVELINLHIKKEGLLSKGEPHCCLNYILKFAWSVLNINNRNVQSKDPLLEQFYHVTDLQY